MFTRKNAGRGKACRHLIWLRARGQADAGNEIAAAINQHRASRIDASPLSNLSFARGHGNNLPIVRAQERLINVAKRSSVSTG
jgi:hypothetical protein